MKMTSSRDIERDMILADAIIVSVLKIEADSLGITTEEYVDKFLDVFYDTPEKLPPLINTKNTA